MKYIEQRWYYIPIAVIISALFWHILGFKNIFVDILSFIFLLRVADDLFDIKKDKKKHSAKHLKIAMISLAIFYVVSNILLYQWMGLFSIIIIIISILMNYVNLLKPFLLTIVILFYEFCNHQPQGYWIAIILICIILGYSFSFIKRRKNVRR